MLTSFFKSVGYRLYSTGITFLISYIVTGSLVHSSQISIVEFITKTFSYFIYENLWGFAAKKLKRE